ncbi:MAG: VOC family protein [Solirubrobacteraceae bacterium]|nr:VOC family protein [Solirubrobacteraceae bacterium]
MIKGLVPNLWFDTQAEAAVNFYVSVFPDSSINAIARYTEAGPGEPGSVMTIDFTVNGQRLVAINGGPQFTFDEAVSLLVECETQDEIDTLWDALIADGGAESQCGWCKDKFGFSWQVVPTGMEELFSDPDPTKAERAVRAMFGMRKLDIAALERAAAGTGA